MFLCSELSALSAGRTNPSVYGDRPWAASGRRRGILGTALFRLAVADSIVAELIPADVRLAGVSEFPIQDPPCVHPDRIAVGKPGGQAHAVVQVTNVLPPAERQSDAGTVCQFDQVGLAFIDRAIIPDDLCSWADAGR